MSRQFTHIHCHSDHSIQDATASIPKIVQRCKEMNWTSIALTDHGTAAGLYAFWRECKENNVHPIIGVEAYVADKLKSKNEKGKTVKDTTYHTVLLARDEEGYRQICRLLYKANTETFYYKPIILTKDLLSIEPGHLIVTTACIGGLLNRVIQIEGKDAAYEKALKFQQHFKDDFYIELQMNELEDQKTGNAALIDVSNKLGIRCILTNDCHYIDEKDVELQKFLYMLRTNSTISNPKMLPSVEHTTYCSYEDFIRYNKIHGYGYQQKDIDSWLDNTNDIANKCRYDFDTKNLKFPVYKDGEDSHKLLAQRTRDALIRKDLHNNKEYVNRLKYELEVLRDKGYCDYFLIFSDIFAYAKEQNIWTSPGRGSAAGCLVSYLLGVTKLDPIHYGLMFERFLDPSPDSTQLPDIDTDWESENRDKIQQYIEDRWGKDKVCQVGTVSVFKLRGAVRDVARVYEIPLDDTNKFSKMLAQELPSEYKPDEMMKYFHDLAKDKKEVGKWLEDEDKRQVLEIASRIHKNVRHRSKHAAGIVVFAKPTWNYIPVDSMGSASGKGRNIISAFSGGQDDKQLEELQTLKLDILGLSTVSILKDVYNLVKERQGKDIAKDLLSIDVEDPKLYEKIQDGRNVGVFQFESNSMNNLIKAVKPKKLNDVVAISSLHRPGQIEFAYKYAENDVEAPPHQIIADRTKDTRGVIVYQEQLMQIIADFMGCSLGATKKFQKILSKKGINPNKPKTWDKKLQKFIKEFHTKTLEKHSDISHAKMSSIIQYLLKYAGYGFNFSHALCYSYIGIQTLWCKIYYPEEFYCAALNNSSKEEDYEKYMEDAQYNGIEILPISFKDSKYNFSIEGERQIRSGFRVLKSFGEKAYEELEKVGRDFDSIEDVLMHPWSKFNKSSLSAINNVNGFYKYNRDQQVAINSAINALTPYDKQCLKKGKQERAKDRISFAMQSHAGEKIPHEKKSEWCRKATGFDYLRIINQNSIMKNIENVYHSLKANSLPTLEDWDKTSPIVCGMILAYEYKTTRNKKSQYLIITIHDGRKSIKTKVWKRSLKGKTFTYSFEKFLSRCYNRVCAFELQHDEWGWSMVQLRKVLK